MSIFIPQIAQLQEILHLFYLFYLFYSRYTARGENKLLTNRAVISLIRKHKISRPRRINYLLQLIIFLLFPGKSQDLGKWMILLRNIKK